MNVLNNNGRYEIQPMLGVYPIGPPIRTRRGLFAWRYKRALRHARAIERMAERDAQSP